MQTKYIFVTGGVLSSLGKGLTAGAIGLLLERKGLRVAVMKLEPYLNVDPGTMNPYQHGEVYVTDDGAETDLDLGHYYRFTHTPLSKASFATSGQIYHTVISHERRGDYLGKTIQIIPHITDEIQQRILQCSKQAPNTQVVIVEVGGTVGDIESLPFLEAIRQFRAANPRDCINIHLTYVPYLKAAGEVKTKPTQHSVQALRQLGLIPDIILCRCEQPLSTEIKEKLSLFCGVPQNAVIDEPDVAHTVYEVPLNLHAQQLDSQICTLLQMPNMPAELSDWEKIVEGIKHPKEVLNIGFVGKYVQHQDAYKCVFEALQHAAIAEGCVVNIQRFEADKIESDPHGIKAIAGCDGYLIPGGYGERGWEGKIAAAKYCREEKIPYFGICFGMQALVVEYARHVCGMAKANSTEINADTPYPVVSMLSEQEHITELGGTMRLGAYRCTLTPHSKAAAAYGSTTISERHRHRYEVNNKFRPEIEKEGLLFSGIFETGNLCEIAEVKDHPWMVGVQFHPEFKSKPTEPHPLFRAFIQAVMAHKANK